MSFISKFFDSWSDDDEPSVKPSLSNQTYLGKIALTGWKPYYSEGVSYSGTTLNIPHHGAGEIDYFMKTAFGRIRYGSKLLFEGSIYVPSGAKFWNEGDPTTNPTMRPILQRRMDDLTKEHYRFWSNPIAVKVNENGTFSKVIYVNADAWTSVYGKKSEVGLKELLANVERVGVTFGGNNNFGHGLSTDSRVEVKITRFEFV